jgi:transposase
MLSCMFGHAHNGRLIRLKSGGSLDLILCHITSELGAPSLPFVTRTRHSQGSLPSRKRTVPLNRHSCPIRDLPAGPDGRVRQLEQQLEALLAAVALGRLRDLLRRPGHSERLGTSRADVRFHHGARPCLGGLRQRGQDGQALGRSRGGFSTKIHLKTDFDGHFLAFDLTGGEAGDAPHFEVLLDLGPDIDPRAALGDKGYDSRANRAACRSRGIIPVIPHRTTARDRPAHFPKALYKGRARIEQSVGKLKRFKRIALGCEKTKTSFLSFIALAAGFILIKYSRRILSVLLISCGSCADRRSVALRESAASARCRSPALRCPD